MSEQVTVDKAYLEALQNEHTQAGGIRYSTQEHANKRHEDAWMRVEGLRVRTTDPVEFVRMFVAAVDSLETHEEAPQEVSLLYNTARRLIEAHDAGRDA